MSATAEKVKLNRSGKKRILVILIFTAVQALIFFAAAGRIDLYRAWVYYGVTILYSIAAFFVFWLRFPHMIELVNERGAMTRENTKTWDKVFMAAYTPILFLAPLVAGLDVGRFGWSSLGEWLVAPGIALFILGMLLIHWAMVVNRHFETSVRIQDDRGHRVVQEGPYRTIRHPGYLGMIIIFPTMPLVTGSLYALIPYGLIVVLLVVRTYFEDRMLKDELAGYREYAATVRYRLIPFIW